MELTKEQLEKVTRLLDFAGVVDRSDGSGKKKLEALLDNADTLIEEAGKREEKLKEIENKIADFDRGLHVPGAGDYFRDKKRRTGTGFNLLKTCVAVTRGGSEKAFMEVGGKDEYELVRNTRKLYASELALLERNSDGEVPIGGRDIARAQNAGIDDEGGNWIPDQVIADRITKVYEKSVFINLGEGDTTRVRVLDGLFGANISIPKFRGGIVAGWSAELQKALASMVRAGMVEMPRKKLTFLVMISEEMRDLPARGLDRDLEDEWVQAMAREIDKAIMYGAGGDDPRGIVNTEGVYLFSAEAAIRNRGGATDPVLLRNAAGFTPAAFTNNTWAGGTVDFDMLMHLRDALSDGGGLGEDDPDDDGVTDMDGRGSIVSNPRLFTALKLLKSKNFTGQADGLPYLFGGMLTDPILREMIGDFGKTSRFKPRAAGATLGATPAAATKNCVDAVMGDLSTVVVGLWGGTKLTRDNGAGLGITNGAELVRGRRYVGTLIRRPGDLVVIPDAKIPLESILAS